MRLKKQTVGTEMWVEGVLWNTEKDLEEFDEKTTGLKV